jgi:hypothetical protein
MADLAQSFPPLFPLINNGGGSVTNVSQVATTICCVLLLPIAQMRPNIDSGIVDYPLALVQKWKKLYTSQLCRYSAQKSAMMQTALLYKQMLCKLHSLSLAKPLCWCYHLIHFRPDTAAWMSLRAREIATV